MTVLVSQRLGIMPVSTHSWNSCENVGANSSVHVLRRWPEMSGPEVFLMLVLKNWRVTSSSEMMISPGEGERMVVMSSMPSDLKSLL